MKNWVMAFRPKTLTAAVAPIVASTAYVYSRGDTVLWWVSGLALLSALFIQIGTNLVNDAVDFKKGADTEERIGPQRVTQSGLISGKTVMIMATVFFLLAILCGIPLVMHGGWPIVIIGLISVMFGYAYTAGPFPLAYLGLGDLFVILFFGIVAVMGMIYLHTGQWLFSGFILGLQIGLLATVLIAINNLRDVNGDKLVNKKTLPVRFGQQFAKYEIAVLIFVPFVLGAYWLGEIRWGAFVLPLALLALGQKIVKFIFFNEPSPAYNTYLAKAAALHILFSVLISVGFLL